MAGLLFLAGCGGAKREAKYDYGEAKNTYKLRGEVLRLKPDRIATIKHEKIEGWMEAMTMDFPVPDAAEWAKLKEGANIRATVLTNDLHYWLTGIQVE
jgi:Cu/Ag efflux protein CusF